MLDALMPFLATAIIQTSQSRQLSPQATPSSPSAMFNRVLPEDNSVVYYMDKHETLESIAFCFYGDKLYWTNIWNDNPHIANPEKVKNSGILNIQVSKPLKPEKLSTSLKNKYTALHPLPVYKPAPVIKSENLPSPVYEDIYKTAGNKFGIPWQILYGIHMTETGGRDGAITSGYGTGAQGPMQFMPGTWRAYGVDGNGDGASDINNAVDAINGAANYLAKHGSLESGLRSYGGNYNGVFAYARAKGYSE